LEEVPNFRITTWLTNKAGWTHKGWFQEEDWRTIFW